MATDTNKTANLTPSTAWDIYVGEQSPTEFMAGHTDIGDATTEYVEGAQNCEDLTHGEQFDLGYLLERYIEATAYRLVATWDRADGTSEEVSSEVTLGDDHCMIQCFTDADDAAEWAATCQAALNACDGDWSEVTITAERVA